MADAAPAPKPGTPEHDAAMVAKYEAANGITTPPPAKPERPADVPEKFWNAETGVVDFAAWSKSTREAEAKITELANAKPAPAAAPPQPTPEAIKAHADGKAALEKALADVKAKADAKPEEVAAAEKALADYPANPQVEAAKTELESRGLDLNEFSKEFAEKGQLSPESYAKLEKSGLSKAVVDQFIEGQRALAAARDGELIKHIGGAEQWTKVSAWANANLNAAERETFNATMQTGTPEQAKLALDGVKARYEAAVGKDPKLVAGGASTGTAGYTSMDAYKADLKDARYRTSEAFRAEVARKLSVTTVF